MIGDVPIVTFDTSAHNRLAQDKDVSRSNAVLEKLNSEYWFRFAALSIEELFATRKAESRKALFASCQAIQRGPSECLLPSNWLTEQMILHYAKDPANFDWKLVNVRCSACENMIRNDELISDAQIAKEQHAFYEHRKELDKKRFVSLRPKIEAIFGKHGELSPTMFQPTISRLEKAEGGSIQAMAQSYYDRVTETNSDAGTVEEFMRVCPPFKALIYAMFVPWFNNAVRDPVTGEDLDAGSNDLYMSVYLPYCDKFITDDWGQARSLRAVASAVGLETQILWYKDFCNSCFVTA